MARIYSAPGIGDQNLIFEVDGVRIFRTPDMAGGDLHEQIVWNESGKIVTFYALDTKIFAYDTETGIGTKYY